MALRTRSALAATASDGSPVLFHRTASGRRVVAEAAGSPVGRPPRPGR